MGALSFRRTSLLAGFSLLALTACPAPEVSITSEPLASSEKAPDAPKPSPAPKPVQGDAEVAIPRPANGVLRAGEADVVLPAGSPPIVRLLDGGAEPRSDLSYALVKGATQKMGMGMDMAVGIKSKGQTLPVTPMPHMTMTLDTSVPERNALAEHRIESRLTSITLDPKGAQQENMARALSAQTDTMKGLGIGYWVTPKGQVRDVKLDIPAGVPPAAQQLMTGMSESFQSMVIPLPQGPIGVGGRWQVVTRISRGGADLLQSSFYTVKSRNGSHVVLDFAVVQLAGNDTIRTAQMPPGMSAKLKSFNSGGTGTTNVDTRSVVPEAGTMTVKTTMELSVQSSSGPEDSTVETVTGVQLSRP